MPRHPCTSDHSGNGSAGPRRIPEVGKPSATVFKLPRASMSKNVMNLRPRENRAAAEPAACRCRRQQKLGPSPASILMRHGNKMNDAATNDGIVTRVAGFRP